MKKNRLRENFILSVVAAAILWGIVAIVFDFYYDLNDDILIKDIVSGIYTGRPEAHNNQMLYPISLLFAVLYGTTDKVAWFGLAEIACFVLSFVIILKSALSFLKTTWQKVLLTAIFTIAFATIYIWELVMLQYTVVAGMLCTAATALVYCHETNSVKEPVRDYIKSMIPAILLLFVAFNFRSEMFLLMCPFMGAAGVARWAREPGKSEDYKGVFDINNVKKYFSIIGVIAVVIALTGIMDSLAYSSNEWKEFRRFFDARTDVYDFTGIPDYEANREFYENNGITAEQYKLLINYNFALDDKIDAEMLENIAQYAKSGNAKNPDGTAYLRTSKSLKTTLGEYIRNVKNIEIKKDYDSSTPFADETGQYAPFGIIVMLLYVAVFVAAFYGKKLQLYVTLATLLLFRSISWLFVFNKGRIVPRITHPMYFIEIVILLLMLLNELREAVVTVREKGRTGSSGPEVTITFCCITAALLMLVSFGCLGTKWSEVKTKSRLRDEVNEQAFSLNNYVSKSASFYYIDVYSTVEWTERVFDSPVSKKNQELAGGWMAFSPLNRQKENETTSTVNVISFVTRENEDELNWLKNWFATAKGTSDISFDKIDEIDGKNGKLNIFDIYY